MSLTFSGVSFSGGLTFTLPPGAPIIGTAIATGSTTATVSYTQPAGSGTEGTPYSVSFTGIDTGSKLTIPHSTQLQVSSSDFTLEAWVYVVAWPSTGDNNYVIFQKGLNTSSTYEWGFSLYRASGYGDNFGFGVGYSANGTTINTASAGSNFITIGNWYHVAVSRNSGTARVYYNGVQAFSISLTTNSYAGSAYVGYGYSATGQNNSFNGYISNLRLVVGTGLYPSGFTPPTSSLTAITNTRLLTCQSSTIIDNGPNSFTITATSATVSATAPNIAGPVVSDIVSHTAVSNPGNITGTLNQSGSGTITVSGLSSSTPYTFTVYATNTAGRSDDSATSNQITTPAANNWANSTTDPIISWTTPSNATTDTFAIPANSNEGGTLWAYAASPFTTWSNFPSSTYVAVAGGVIFNGVTYSGYIKSADWGKGNTAYQQRFISAIFGTKITQELTARANRLFPTPSS